MKVVAVFLGSIALIAGADAHAQMSTVAPTATHIAGARPAQISTTKSLSEIDRGRISGADFARCVAKTSPKRVDAALALPEASREAMARLASTNCLVGGELRFDAHVLRGALFVEMYRERSTAESQGEAWNRSVALLDVNAPVAPAAMGRAALLQFADCVVRRNPAVARDVVLLPTASVGQEAALKKLKPDLGPCFRSGSNMTLSKAVLEGALAEILYRTPAASLTPVVEEKK